MDGATVDLMAEIKVNPREGAGSSVVDRVEFYKETGGATPVYIGTGKLVPGSSPAQYKLSYSAAAHGAVGQVQDLLRQLRGQVGRRTAARRFPPTPSRCGSADFKYSPRCLVRFCGSAFAVMRLRYSPPATMA